VDTTAAGDTFTGYFIGSLAQGYEALEALRLASLAAAISVSRNGAETSIPFMEEVKTSMLQLK
jgi:ribokinase